MLQLMLCHDTLHLLLNSKLYLYLHQHGWLRLSLDMIRILKPSSYCKSYQLIPRHVRHSP